MYSGKCTRCYTVKQQTLIDMSVRIIKNAAGPTVQYNDILWSTSCAKKLSHEFWHDSEVEDYGGLVGVKKVGNLQPPPPGSTPSCYGIRGGCGGGGSGDEVMPSSIRGKLQEWILKASSCSECMLLSERRSGSLSSSLVKVANSLGWFLVIRLRSAQINVSCSASTEFTFSIPERSVRTGPQRSVLDQQ